MSRAAACACDAQLSLLMFCSRDTHIQSCTLPGEVRTATRAIWTLAVRNAQQSSFSVNNIVNVNMVITMLLQAFVAFSRMEH
jgi:hypothetical protein